MEQYRRPDALYDLRYYDLPTENYESMLYYRYPRMGQPVNRGTFRDKPHCVPRHYPEMAPEGKPAGYFGRMYYEDGPPKFKYDGPKKDDLYWLERPPYLPNFPSLRQQSGEMRTIESNAKPLPTPPSRGRESSARSTSASSFQRHYKPASQNTDTLLSTYREVPTKNTDYLQSTRKISQSGVGYL